MPLYSPVRFRLELWVIECQTTRYRELFIIALFAGLRRGELLALRWEDLGSDDAYIDVKRTYNPYEPGRVGATEDDPQLT